MDFKIKQHKIIKTKKLLKNNNILFFCKGANWNFKSLIKIEQQLWVLNFTRIKILNKIHRKIIKNSVLKSNKILVNGLVYLIFYLKIKLLKKKLINFLNLPLFNIFAVQINNKIYNKIQIKRNFSLNYLNYQLLVLYSTISIFKNRF